MMKSAEASSNMDAALKRGEREKQMEILVCACTYAHELTFLLQTLYTRIILFTVYSFTYIFYVFSVSVYTAAKSKAREG